MFDKVWNGEYNEYAVDIRIIGVETLYSIEYTVGAVRNETLVFVNFSAQDASILKISVPIIKRRSWGFQNTPNLQNSDYFEPSYSNLKKMEDLQKLGS